MPSGTTGVPTGSGQKNGMVIRDRKSGLTFVSLTCSFVALSALRPLAVCAFPSKTACAPTMTSMKDWAGDCIFGFIARFQAYTNV
jgi:hypothetical protein